MFLVASLDPNWRCESHPPSLEKTSHAYLRLVGSDAGRIRIGTRDLKDPPKGGQLLGRPFGRFLGAKSQGLDIGQGD